MKKLSETQVRFMELIEQGGYVTAINRPRWATYATARALNRMGLLHLRGTGGARGWSARRLYPDVVPAARDGRHFRRGDMITFGMVRGVVLAIREIAPINGPAGWAVEWQDVATQQRFLHEVTNPELNHKV